MKPVAVNMRQNVDETGCSGGARCGSRPSSFSLERLPLERMISPNLPDSVERVIRDPERKFGWNDRLIGAIRLCPVEGITPENLLKAWKFSGTEFQLRRMGS